MTRHGIAEWYGEPFAAMTPARRRALAAIALDRGAHAPPCPFQRDSTPCHKPGGVCSFRRYERGGGDRIGAAVGAPVILCPRRFDENDLVVRWLAEIVGFDTARARVAHEVPFMRSAATDKAAGRIDMVVAAGARGGSDWFGLEIQAVYFSGRGMRTEFERLLRDGADAPPFPDSVRRPDWRSSSAKRLMPQLQIKVPTLRMWGKKLAVAVDRPFFDAIGGASANPIRDLDDGEVVWLAPSISPEGRLERGHWEMLSLDASSKRLRAADTVRRAEFEEALFAKLQPLERIDRESRAIRRPSSDRR